MREFPSNVAIYCRGAKSKQTPKISSKRRRARRKQLQEDYQPRESEDKESQHNHRRRRGRRRADRSNIYLVVKVEGKTIGNSVYLVSFRHDFFVGFEFRFSYFKNCEGHHTRLKEWQPQHQRLIRRPKKRTSSTRHARLAKTLLISSMTRWTQSDTTWQNRIWIRPRSPGMATVSTVITKHFLS